MIVQISAGQGPEECQIAVGKLFEAWKKEFSDIDCGCKYRAGICTVKQGYHSYGNFEGDEIERNGTLFLCAQLY